MPTMKEQLLELRNVAERFALGDAESRKLRGLIVDFFDVLLGRVPNHPDVNNSGARFLPNDPGVRTAQHAISPVQQIGPISAAGIEQPRDVVAIGTVRMGPHGPWAWNGQTGEPEATANAPAPSSLSPAAAAAAARPQTVAEARAALAAADPAGPNAMEAIAAELIEQEKKTNANGSTTTPPGGQ